MSAPVIRPETPDDMEAIHQIQTAGFGRPDEARLVQAIRDSGDVTFSLVAELDGQVVGHVIVSPVTITPSNDEPYIGLGLGPIAVDEDRRGQGVGAALMREALARCKADGHELVFVLGSPDFYPQFGFQPAIPLGFDSAYTQGEGDHPYFMVAVLQPGAERRGGFVRYHPAFEGV